REIFNATSDALLVHDADGRIIDANAQASVLFGAERAALLDRSLGDFSLGASPFGEAEAAENLRRALGGEPQLFEWRSRRASGELFWAEVALREWETGGQRRAIAAVRDISNRKAAQEAVRINDERLRMAMAASSQGWFELHVPTGQGILSDEYVRMLEYEPAEFRSDLQAWISRIHPADRDETVQAYRQGLATGRLTSMEYRQCTRTGGWKWIRSVAKVVEHDAAGRPVRVMGTHTDITERKELEAQLLHSQRLEAVGTLASGVAHDLNNILTPMLMASGVLRDKLTDPKDRELMALLDEGGRRGAGIVRQLLAFSRNLAQDRVPVDPRQLLRDMVRLMEATFPKEIRVVEAVADGSEMVEAEPTQLHQVLMNLCVNARDAMPEGGTITLRLERVDLPETSELKAGPYLALRVADTGQGIPPEIRERIFDPFFTTKPLGKGTGLGLASVHGIVTAHRGIVRVESERGQGSTFSVFLPVRDEETGAKTAAAPLAPAPTVSVRGAGVLIVDDDPGVLMVTSRLLERMGYGVWQATGGAEAIDVLRQNQGAVELVITDFSMPGMDGPALAPQLRAIAPGLRIIGVSGLNQDHRAAELRALGIAEVLSKPYEWDDLLHAVQRHLGGGAKG
ncbi:MAG TPA: ATP-binding protein, partial [Lacunisphaera sp.]|nr:ATP-binding protein [Lacunisphaera sp.]